MCVGCLAGDAVAMEHSEKSKNYEDKIYDQSNTQY